MASGGGRAGWGKKKEIGDSNRQVYMYVGGWGGGHSGVSIHVEICGAIGCINTCRDMWGHRVYQYK